MSRAAIPKLHIDTSHLPSHERFDAYAAAIQGLIEPSLPSNGYPNSNWSCTYWEIGSLIFCTYDHGPLRVKRHSRHIDRLDERYVILRYQHGGETRFESGDDRAILGSGQFHAINIAMPFDMLQETRIPGKTVFIPHRLLGLDGETRPRLGSFETKAPLGTLVTAAVDAVFSRASSMSLTDAARMSDGVAALIKRSLFTTPLDVPETALARDAAASSVEIYVERRLMDETLSIRTICRDLNLSRSTVYRIMKKKGGVMNFIKERRLTAAMTELSVSRPTVGRVQEIAERFGYHDYSLFGRQFKARFGVSPSDVLGRFYPTSVPATGVRAPEVSQDPAHRRGSSVGFLARIASARMRSDPSYTPARRNV
ncbi:MAG: helix-turn-helix domain-containing protein [Pseudomonadota bacterium]